MFKRDKGRGVPKRRIVGRVGDGLAGEFEKSSQYPKTVIASGRKPEYVAFRKWESESKSRVGAPLAPWSPKMRWTWNR